MKMSNKFEEREIFEFYFGSNQTDDKKQIKQRDPYKMY